MKKLFSLVVLAMMSAGLISCSSDDDNNGRVVPAQLFGQWTLVNDAEPTVVTTLNFTNEPFTNFSATYTAVNPTIPANSPTYTKEIVTTTHTYPNEQKEYVREQGYFTISGNILTFWPHVSRTSADGTIWTETAIADLASMEVYSFVLNNANVMVFTKGDGTKQTYIR